MKKFILKVLEGITGVMTLAGSIICAADGSCVLDGLIVDPLYVDTSEAVLAIGAGIMAIIMYVSHDTIKEIRRNKTNG